VATIPPTDEELDMFIRTRLALIGVDLSVLPVSDQDAPADQARVLSSTRGVLRNSVTVISDYNPDVQTFIPALYPAPFSEWAQEDDDRKSLRQRHKQLGFG
jgi:hypothetical protein